MTTLEEIGAALQKADAAGNTEDAKRLADAYREMKAGAPKYPYGKSKSVPDSATSILTPSRLLPALRDAIFVPKGQRETMTQAVEGGDSLGGVGSEIWKEGGQAFGDIGGALSEPGLTSSERATRVGMDVLGGVFSPLTGTATSAIGRPLEAATGVRREITGDVLSALVPIGWQRAPVEAAETASKMSKAHTLLSERMAQDAKAGGPTAQSIIDEFSKTPTKPLSLADLGGENVQALAGNLARTPGESRQIMRSVLSERDQAAGARTAEDVSQSLGRGSAYEAGTVLQAGRAKASAPLYEEAYAANQNMQSPVIDRILRTPAGVAALKAARVKMQNDMTLMGRPDPELMEQVKESGQQLPFKGGPASGLKLRTLDYVKRAMDDQIGVKVRAGEKDDARILTGLKKDLVKAIDNADVTAKAGPSSLKPEGGAYARARAEYSGSSQSMDALEAGQKVLSNEPEAVKAEFSQLSPGDQEFYRLGAASALRKTIAKTGASGDEARKIIGNDYVRSQLKPLFKSSQDFDKFINSLSAESKMWGTKQKIVGGSQTAERVSEDEALKAGLHAAGAVGHASSGNWIGAALDARRARNALRGLSDPAMNKELAQILSSSLADQLSPGQKFLRDFGGPETQKMLNRRGGPTFQFPAPLPVTNALRALTDQPPNNGN